MEANDKLRFGIIGCGAAAELHATALRETDLAYLVGAADLRREKVDAFSGKFGCASFESIDAMLGSDSVDCVCICSPSGYHADLAVRAIGAGKHVLIEKPLALNTADCDRVAEAAKRCSRTVGVVSQFRFNPTVARLKAEIDSGTVGKVVTADLFMKYNRTPEYYSSSAWRGTWALDGGGALMNQGIHGIDTLLYVMGVVRSVYGIAKTMVHGIEVEDTASAVLEFKSGAIGIIQGTTSVYPGYPRELSVSGTDGTLAIAESVFVKWDVRGGDVPDDIEIGGEIKSSARGNPMNLPIGGHVAQINDYAKAVMTGTSPSVGLAEGRRAVEVITAIYESHRTHRPVDLL